VPQRLSGRWSLYSSNEELFRIWLEHFYVWMGLVSWEMLCRTERLISCPNFFRFSVWKEMREWTDNTTGFFFAASWYGSLYVCRCLVNTSRHHLDIEGILLKFSGLQNADLFRQPPVRLRSRGKNFRTCSTLQHTIFCNTLPWSTDVRISYSSLKLYQHRPQVAWKGINHFRNLLNRFKVYSHCNF